MRRGRAKPSNAVRALLFIALSGAAVPACQHYEAGGKPDREQADLRVTVPSEQVEHPST